MYKTVKEFTTSPCISNLKSIATKKVATVILVGHL